jgi:serine phosphatase RsbU (regulator of sigma subunit)
VPDAAASRLDVGRLLAAVETAAPVAAADVLGSELARMMGAREVSFLIADFSGMSLIRLGHAGTDDASRTQGRETAEHVALAGTAHGRALAEQTVQVVDDGSGKRVIAPVTSRGEAVGVLELSVATAPDERTVADIALAAHALAYVIIANRRYTDLFVWGQRSVPLSLAAEIQHRLLPGSFTCEAGQFTLAAWLEPAGDVGGDTFDFALERDTLHLSITDAMGHTIQAALLASLTLGALRSGRRRGLSLQEQATSAGEAIHSASRSDEYVTGEIVRVDLRQETATIVNAGHPAPFRIRDGVATQIPLDVDLPLGAMQDTAFAVQPLPLEPGDRLMFLTDGIIERNGDLDVAGVLAASAGVHPREAVQGLTHAVLAATNGRLRDDATVLCLDWHGGPPRDRDSESGSDRPAAGTRR